MTAASEFYRREAARLKEMAFGGTLSGEVRWNMIEIAKKYEVLAQYSEFLRAKPIADIPEAAPLVSKTGSR